MTNLMLTPSTKNKVREFLLNTQSTQDQQDELQQFLKNLSPSLRAWVTENIYTDAMTFNEVLKAINQNGADQGLIENVVKKLVILSLS